eukprot:scaffold54752_cov15-Tisochrysis_lutea.AAC.1
MSVVWIVRRSIAFALGPKQVQEACQKWLQRSFADVHEVITKEELLEAFQQLCPRAVLTWMKHDDLIGTENDVAFLVTCWYEGEQVRWRVRWHKIS